VRVTANQITLLRLFLLPFPVWMIYRGTRAWLLAALGVMIVLGLTDAIDGMLARRHGSTALGALLDPIVDKIFLVASFGPLADLRIVPSVLVVVLFVRELAVTALRSAALEEAFRFRTTRIAKLKTVVQMAGAGILLLLHMFRDGRGVSVLLGLGIVGAVAPAAVQWARGRTPGWMAWSAAALVGPLVVLRFLFGADVVLAAVMLMIAGLTVISGAGYFWEMRGVLQARFTRRPVEAARLLAVSLVVPLVYLPLMQRPGAPIWAILLVLAAELAIGGVDNSLVQSGIRRGPGPDLGRSAALGVVGLALVAATASGASPLVRHGLGGLALAITLADLLGLLMRHGHVLLDATATRGSAPSAAPVGGGATRST